MCRDRQLMFPLLELVLEARNPDRNVARLYGVELGQDLLGDLVLVITNGRIGSPGRTRRCAVPDEAAARRALRQVLLRRGTARRRLGAPYFVRELTGEPAWTDGLGLPGNPVRV